MVLAEKEPAPLPDVEYHTPPSIQRQLTEADKYRTFTHEIVRTARGGYDRIFEESSELLRSAFSVLRATVVYGETVYSSDTNGPGANSYIEMKKLIVAEQDRIRFPSHGPLQILGVPLQESANGTSVTVGVIILEWFGKAQMQPMSDSHIDSIVTLFISTIGAVRNLTIARAMSDERVIGKMATQETTYPLAERREIAVLFGDLSGSTALAERLSPNDFIETINMYHTAAGEILRKHKLYIDKFQGDAVMAVSNAFGDQTEDYIVRVVRAAIEIQDAIGELNKRLRVERGDDWPVMELKIGIHAGPAIFGPVGMPDRYDMTVIGDTVNTTKRVEESTLAGQICITQEVYDVIKDDPSFVCISKGTPPLKGKSNTVNVFILEKCA